MALVNPNIALSVKPVELQDPMAQYGKVMAIQGAQNQNALNQYQLSAAKRADETQNMLARAYSESVDPASGKIDYNKLTGLVAAGGGGAQLPAIQKSRMEQDTSNTKLLADKLALLPEAYKRADTPEAYLTLHQSVHADPVIGPWLNSIGATPEKGLATLQNAINTGKFDELRVRSMQSVAQVLEGLKPVTVAASSSVYDPSTKTFVQAPAAPETTDPEVKRYEYAKGQGYKGTLFDFKREMAMAGRTPAQPAAPTITQVVDPANPNQMLVVDARRYQGGGAGSPGVIGVGGKEPGAALRTNKAEEGKTQLANDLDNLRSSFAELDRLRAIPSTERGVVSNLMSATQSSGIGQVLGRAGGTKEQVERDVINSARLRLVSSIKNATGMSSKSLDSNVELQTMLRSLSDPGQSVDAALRIIDDIEDAYVKGNGTLPKRGDKKPPADGANVVVTPDGQSHTFPTPAAAAQFKKAAGIP
jgi:hypothetical protein